MTEPLRLDLWSDVACPWCAIGWARLGQALAAHAEEPDARPVAVTLRSYQLAPDLAPDFEGGHDDYLAGRLGLSPSQVAGARERVGGIAAGAGVTLDPDRVVIANTGKAHQLLHLAKAKGVQAAMADRLFRAYWAEGRRLGRVGELAALAAEAGIDEGEARAALEAGTYAGAVAADVEQAARHGIRGVPFLVLAGRYGLSGAQEPETLRRAIAQAAAEAA